MIDFEEELEKFKPSLELEQAEDVIGQENMVDVTDLINQVINGQK